MVDRFNCYSPILVGALLSDRKSAAEQIQERAPSPRPVGNRGCRDPPGTDTRKKALTHTQPWEQLVLIRAPVWQVANSKHYFRGPAAQVNRKGDAVPAKC